MTLKFLKNAKWTLLAAFVLMGIAIASGASFFYFAAYCWLALIVGSLVIHRFNLKSLMLQFEMDQTEVAAGELISIRYRIINNSVVPAYNVSIQPIISKAFGYSKFETERLAFDSFEMKTIERKVVAKRRGFYTLGQVHMDLIDPLEVVKHQYEKQRVIDVIVRPNVYDVGNLRLSAKELMGWKGQSLKTLQDKTSIKHVREYRTGDSIRDVHFKLSAKTGTLKTKEYAQSVTTTLIILIDGERRAYESCPELSDDMMDLAASIVSDVLKRQIPVKLIFSDEMRTTFSGKNFSAFNGAIEHLTAFTPTGAIAFEGFIEREMKLYPAGASLMTLSRTSTVEGLRKLIDLRRFGIVADHFALVTHEEYDNLVRQSILDGMDPFRNTGLYIGTSAKHILEPEQGRWGS